ncbi:MAG: hypothetical protein HKP14_08060 [Bacteroidia bacterium]|nr:hypothetical protein [Bacteroidia bacterium]
MVIFLCGCTEDSVIEIKEDNETTLTSLETLSELISTFDILDDLASSHDAFKKKENELLPSDAKLTYHDVSFIDGTGVDFEIDFGKLGNEPSGLLCKDGKYRAGKILVKLTRPYSEIGTVMTVVFPKEQPFYSGDGSNMERFVGTIKLTREDDDEITLITETLESGQAGSASDVSADLLITKEVDNGIGILNDEVLFGGELKIENAASSVEMKSIQPLKKVYSLICAKNIVGGELSVKLSESISDIYIDFDPDNDEACDNKVAIVINGKSVIYNY